MYQAANPFMLCTFVEAAQVAYSAAATHPIMDVSHNGQNNIDRLCNIIWSTVGVVCPTWSSSVDEHVRLSILTISLLFPFLDVLRCLAQDILSFITRRSG